MATIRDILGDDTLKFENDFKAQGLNGKDLESAMIKLARDTRTQREQQEKQILEQKNEVAQGYQNDFNSLFMADNPGSQILRGLATGGNRLISAANYLGDKVGFDLLSDKTTNTLNEMQNLFDKKKEDISREDITPERLAELQKLDIQNQNATGIIDNLKAGVNTMADTLIHPSEWTIQGVTETVTDPLNALSFGAGSLASKLGRTMVQKTALGATGGAIEGASVNAGAEYTIARGQDKTEEEASKIATQSLGAGALAGGTFGAVGGAVGGYTPQFKEKLNNIKSKNIDEILDNDLLKGLEETEKIKEDKPSNNYIDLLKDNLKDEKNDSRERIIIALDNTEAYNSLDKSQRQKADELIKIKNEFDSYEASLKNTELERDKIFNDIQQNTKRKIPEFKTVYDNLPTIFTPEQINKIDTKLNDFVVQEQFKIESIYPEKKESYTPNFKFVSEKLPTILRELVDTEIIDEPTAKQIEYKNKTILLGHKDIIYAGLDGWKQSVSQSIIDAINGNKISKIKRTEDVSFQATQQSQLLAKDLAEKGADATTIKDTINNKIIPTKDELDFTNILNDGMPVENRFSGARLRTAIQNSISNPIRTPDEFASILKGAGFNDSVTKIATQSYINKTLDSFDEYITTKISKVNDEQIKAITKKIDDEIIITEDNLQEWLKENPIIKNDSPEMTYRNAVDELDNLQNKSPESITNENLVKFIKDRYGDDGVALHKNYSKQVELESQADDLHSTILDIEDEITNLRDEKATIADNPNVSKEDITNYDTEIFKLEKEAQKLTNKKQNIDNKIQNIVGDSIQYEKNITAQKYPQFVRNNMISLKELQDNNIAPLTYEDIYKEIKKDYTDINNLPDDKKEFMKSISYGGRLEKAKNKVDKKREKLLNTQKQKSNLEEFISKEIGDENILTSQKEMLLELDKTGLVKRITSSKLKQKLEGQIDTNKKEITLNSNLSAKEKAQVLIHEYIHDATESLRNNKRFSDDLDFLVSEAKKSFEYEKKDINQYGFKNSSEFMAEAFSNPAFARSLNDVKLSPKTKERLGVKRHINTLWEAITQKFSEVVFEMTGRRLKINSGTYLDALDNMIKEAKNQESSKRANSENKILFSKETDFSLNDKNSPHENVYSKEQSISILEDMRNEIEYHKLSEEEQSMYDVYMGNKTVAEIKSNDLKDMILLEKGSRRTGAKKIVVKHGGKDKTGGLDYFELLGIGEVIRKGDISRDSFSETKNSIRYGYDLTKENQNFRVVVEEFNDGRKVIDYYSDRNFLDYGKEPTYKKGMSETTRQSQHSLNEKIISKNDQDVNEKNSPRGNLENPNILNKEADSNNKTIFEKIKDFNYDQFADNTTENISNFFHGLNKDGSIKEGTNKGMDFVRKFLVPNAQRQKDFVKLLGESQRQKARIKANAKLLQEDINKLDKEDRNLLTMALDGDVLKENIEQTLGADLFKVYKNIRANIDEKAKKLTELGLLDEKDVKEDYLKRFYEKHVENKGLFYNLFKNGYKLDKTFKRKDLSQEVRAELGQIKDAGYVVARTILEQENQIAKGEFLKILADEYSTSKPKDGFVQIPDDKSYGKLAGRYVSQNIKNELDNLRRMESHVDNFAQKYIKDFSRWLKGNWTAGNISTHAYNVASNGLNLYLNGLLLTTRNGRVIGGSYGANGIRKIINPKTRDSYKKELTRLGLYDDSFFDTLEKSLDGVEANNASITKDIFNGMLFKRNSRITKNIEKIYDFEDKVYRIFAYEELKWDAKVAKYKANGNTISKFDKETKQKINQVQLSQDEKIKVMNEARDMFVDYSKPVPDWIQTADNYMILPFARYTYLATIRQAKTAIKHPIRAMAVSMFLGDAIKALFGEFEELDDNDPLKPDWMKQSFTNWNMYLVNNWTKVKDTKDEALYFNTGRLIPGFRMYEIGAGFYGDLYNAALKGKDRFDREFSNKHEPVDEKTLRRVSKISEMILPPLFPLAVPVMWNTPRLTAGGNLKKDKNGKIVNETVSIGGRYGQKMLGSISGSKLDRYGQPLKEEDVIKQILGMKLERIDKKAEAEKQLKALKDEYVPKIRREESLGNQKAKIIKQKEYDKKVSEIKKAAPTFREEKKKDSRFDAKFKF